MPADHLQSSVNDYLQFPHKVFAIMHISRYRLVVPNEALRCLRIPRIGELQTDRMFTVQRYIFATGVVWMPPGSCFHIDGNCTIPNQDHRS